MNFWVYDITRRPRNLKFLTASLITTAKWGCDIDLFKLIPCAHLNIKRYENLHVEDNFSESIVSGDVSFSNNNISFSPDLLTYSEPQELHRQVVI